jgi:Metallo-beta-lactamase superfamily
MRSHTPRRKVSSSGRQIKELYRITEILILMSIFGRLPLTLFGLSAFRRLFLSSAFVGTTSFGRTAVVSRASFAAALFSTTQQAMARSTLSVVQVPCLNDNYGYILHDEATGQTAVVDTPEVGPYQRELNARGWKLTHILNTHHHWDHTGGNEELKTNGVQVFGPATETIPGIDVKLNGGDEIEFGSTKAKIIDVGGHTKGHIAYNFPDDAKVFVGDSLFALGCGRMFEGTPDQFW